LTGENHLNAVTAMVQTDTRKEAIAKNYEAFRKELPELMKTHAGKFAVLRHEKIAQFFDTAADAVIFAQASYPDGLYSVQAVSESVVDLGFFSQHAVH
jgi:hypothetical protein